MAVKATTKTNAVFTAFKRTTVKAEPKAPPAGTEADANFFKAAGVALAVGSFTTKRVQNITRHSTKAACARLSKHDGSNVLWGAKKKQQKDGRDKAVSPAAVAGGRWV